MRNAGAMVLDELAREELRRVLAPFAERITSAAIFGSRATGRARLNSDIDLVLHGDLTQEHVDRLHTLFEESSLAVTVDVVAYSPTLSPMLKQHVDRFARPLFCRDDLLAAACPRAA